MVRGDSHFASPEVMQWIEAQADLSYVTGSTSNAFCKRWRGRWSNRPNEPMGAMGARAPASTRRITKPGRVSFAPRGMKGEVSDQGVNTRFVVRIWTRL